ncbi:hypothetical protein [Mesorhizobium salmacidum]|uniref:Uncharacterized protein n=1 Tax=Mesorhizobium salmacidum TaxID=3015171 RepID=A0ABU8L5I9_9HYPH
MTRALTDVLAGLNTVFAFLITLGGGFAGWAHLHERGASAGLVGAISGLMAGFALAAVVCGTLATLLLIENHLHNLLTAAERDRARKQ